MNDETYNYGQPVLLCSIEDDVITGILLAALKDNNIPVMKKTRGFFNQSIAIVMGYSNKTADIYVPSDLLEKAREIFIVITGETED